MKIGRAAGLTLRFAVLAGLLAAAWIYRGGVGDVARALDTGGWAALAAVCAWHLTALFVCAMAEWSLSPDNRTTGLWPFLVTRWVHEAVGELTGFIPLSGEVAAGRALMRQGVAATKAAALTVVDLTCEALGQFVFTMIGIALWLTYRPAGAVGHWALIGLGISAPLLIALLLVQRSPLVRFIETLPARMMPKTWTAPEEEQGTLAIIHALYANRPRIAIGTALHLGAWLIATGEAALALMLLGHPLALVDVVAMEAFIMALRSAAIIVPAGLGVQEAAYVVIGGLLGLPPEVALALSVLKRGRELLYGVPGLIAWQAIEGRRKKAAA
ncbi:MAG TPA: lysylphosphatidylglycerol synthase domain-containing protein [Magnetospirillaceae bacterium]|jgi:putative membrane protein